MPSNNVERVRRHVLPDGELSGLVDAVILLLDAARRGCGIRMTLADGSGGSAVLTGVGLEASLDGLSLLGAGGGVALCAVDDGKMVKMDRLSEMLEVKTDTLASWAVKYGVEARQDREGKSYPFYKLLEAFQKHRDNEVAERVVAELLTTGGPELVALIKKRSKGNASSLSRDTLARLDQFRGNKAANGSATD